jgi:hypothetical protein
MDPVLLGYFPKRLSVPPDWMRARGVEEIGSVSLCIAGGPDGWLEAWKHNPWGFFSSPETARSLVPGDERADYRLYAYALYPVEYREDGEEPMEVDAPEATPLGREYDLVGYDVASRSAGSYFECSPLSCNMLAEEIDVNRYCLFSTLDDARELARSAEEKRCEPGPYHVVQVWRERAVEKGS